MSDRLFFGLCALAAIVMIALALVWPQGLGSRSPGPFGHAVAAIKAPAKPEKPPRPRKTPKTPHQKGPPPGSLAR